MNFRERAFKAFNWLTAANGVIVTYKADISRLVPIIVEVIARTALVSTPSALSILVDCCHTLSHVMDGEFPKNSVAQGLIDHPTLLSKMLQMCSVSAELRNASLTVLHSLCYAASHAQLAAITTLTHTLSTLQMLVAHPISHRVSLAVCAIVAEICAGEDDVLTSVDQSGLTTHITKLATTSNSEEVKEAAALAIIYYFHGSNRTQTHKLLTTGGMKIVVNQLDIKKPVLALEALKVLTIMLSTKKFQTRADFDRVIAFMNGEDAWIRLTSLIASSSASSSSSSSSSSSPEHGDIHQLAQDLMDKGGLGAAMSAFETAAEESKRAHKKAKMNHDEK
jgi:hypothetical protein